MTFSDIWIYKLLNDIFNEVAASDTDILVKVTIVLIILITFLRAPFDYMLTQC